MWHSRERDIEGAVEMTSMIQREMVRRLEASQWSMSIAIIDQRTRSES
jgi:hypothetical protein